MTNITFQGIWRMDWGFGNPNKTAALIAILMVAVWALAYFRRWGFWIALTSFIGLGVALIHTFSRGGLISMAAGIFALLIWAPRPWIRSKLIAGLLGFWVMVGVSVYLKAHERYSQGVVVEDRSISNRVQLWKVTPSMMVDSSKGWGWGNSGNAYMQWYQPMDKNESYRTLVNSHLTWLVEFGWPMRFLYIFAWILVLVICWPSDAARWRSIPFGVWLSFFTAAFFSSVAESLLMWIIPGLFLLAAVAQRILARQYLTRLQYILPFGVTAAIILGIWIAGQTSLPLNGSKQAVLLGGAEPKVWICYDVSTMGNLYGKRLRTAYVIARKFSSSSVGMLFSNKTPPRLNGQTLVLGSTLPNWPENTLKSAVRDCHELILLSPRFSPEEIGVDFSNKAKVKTYFGVFSQSPNIASWQSFSNSLKVPGAGDFLPNWASLALSLSL